jgi:pimeloyl-ACP methyl ester carboxylesterase
MFFEKKGSGPSVVLIHGLGANLFSWRETVAALSGRFTTYAVDLLGFGNSAAPAGFAYTAKAQAEAVAAFMKAEGLSHPNIIGHSMGGGVCLYLADEAVHGRLSLGQMVLVAPVTSPPTSTAGDTAGLLGGAAVPGFGRVLAERVLKRAYANPSRITPAQIDGYAKGLSSPDQIHAFVEHSRNLIQISFSVSLLLAKIKFKTLIIWGKNDKFLEPARGDKLKGDLPNASLQSIDDCGHIPQEEQPAETNDAIGNFLI